MTSQNLPPLGTLKSRAKALKRAFASSDAHAVARFDAVFGARPVTGQLANCLHVIAVEAGFESWPKLKFAIEADAMTREERVRQLTIAVAEGTFHIVDRLLALDPSLATASFGLACAFYDRPFVDAALARDPGLATTPDGKRRPILHLAFSRWHRRRPELISDCLTIAGRLVDAGAEVDDGFPAEPGSGDLLSVLYGALGHAGNLPLARWLLEHGANPDDNESFYHATELGHLDGVKLMMEFGATLAGTNAFFRMLDFDDLEGARLLIDYGADVNEPPAQYAEDPDDWGNALHHAIRRGRDGRFADLLIAAGADPHATWGGHSAFALAQVTGNRSMVEALARHGLAHDLRPDPAFMAAIMAENEAAARALAATNPTLVEKLGTADRRLIVELASQPGAIRKLRLMVALGFDPTIRDDAGMTPLHVAAWHGRADHVALFLDAGKDLERENAYGGTALGTAIHGQLPGRRPRRLSARRRPAGRGGSAHPRGRGPSGNGHGRRPCPAGGAFGRAGIVTLSWALPPRQHSRAPGTAFQIGSGRRRER